MMNDAHYIEAETCPRCEGTGIAIEPSPTGGHLVRSVCPDCDGHGFIVPESSGDPE